MARRSTPNLSIAADTFVRAQFARTGSTQVRNGYRSLLGRLTKHLKDRQVGSVGAGHLEDFFYGRRGLTHTCGRTTLAKYRTQMITFLRWCDRREYLSKPVHVLVEGLREKSTQNNRDRFRMTRAELRRLIDGAPSARDRALIAFVANTGLRISEAIGMTVRDVSFSKGELYVYLQKTDEHVTTPLSSDLEHELRAWLTAYAEMAGELRKDYFLFPAGTPHRYGRGRTTGERGVKPECRIGKPQPIIKGAAERAGIELEPGDAWHTIRRSFARLVYEDARSHGHDDALRLAQAALNHARVTTTEKYLGLDMEKQRFSKMIKGRPFLTADLEAGGRDKIVSLDERRADRG